MSAQTRTVVNWRPTVGYFAFTSWAMFITYAVLGDEPLWQPFAAGFLVLVAGRCLFPEPVTRQEPVY